MNNTNARTVIEKCGGCSEVARAFGISRQAVSKWGKNQVPAHWVPKLSKISGVRPEEIRPDVFVEP